MKKVIELTLWGFLILIILVIFVPAYVGKLIGWPILMIFTESSWLAKIIFFPLVLVAGVAFYGVTIPCGYAIVEIYYAGARLTDRLTG